MNEIRRFLKMTTIPVVEFVGKLFYIYFFYQAKQHKKARNGLGFVNVLKFL